jgi:hypothetical protein
MLTPRSSAVFKAGGDVSDMRVPAYISDNAVGVGAMWYQALPMDAQCPYDDGTENQSAEWGFWEKPYGFDSGRDTVNWAIVLEPAFQGSSLEIYSGGVLMEVVILPDAGLSYGSISTRNPGPQFMQLKDQSGNIQMSAVGGECVYEPQQCLRFIYDMNFSVVGFQLGEQDNFCNTVTIENPPLPADVTISLDIVSAAAPTFPTFTAMPFATGPSLYSAGDTLQTLASPPNQDIAVDLTLVGSPVVWDSDFCGDGSGTSDCIVESVEFMVYAINLQGGPVQTTLRRDIPASDFQFQYHSQWLPPTTSNSNATTNTTCSTPRCMLLAGAPKHTWTPVGNGTYKGRFHEFHFLHTGTMLGHRVLPGGFPSANVSIDNTTTNASLVGRQYDTHINLPHSQLELIEYYTRENEQQGWRTLMSADSAAKLDMPKNTGVAVGNMVSLSNFHEACVTMALNGVGLVTGLWNIGTNDTATELSNAQAENDTAGCSLSAVTPSPPPSVTLVCGANLTKIDPTLVDDPDGTEEGNIWSRSLLPSNILGLRSASSGQSAPYTIHNYLDPNGVTVTFESATYANGGDGQDLIDAGGDDHVYALANRGVCTDTSIISDADITGPNAVTVNSEHVFERVTVPYFFEFIQNPYLDLEDGNGLTRAPANQQPILFNVVRDYMQIPYNEWPFASESGIPNVGSLFQDIAEALGSTTNPSVMTNLQEDLNNVKSRVWDTFVDPTADGVFLPLANNPTVANTSSALDLLRSVSSQILFPPNNFRQELNTDKLYACRV